MTTLRDRGALMVGVALALVALVGLVIPMGALAQEASPEASPAASGTVPAGVEPVTSTWPPLVGRSGSVDAETICGWSGGTLDVGDVCMLRSEDLGAGLLGRTFGTKSQVFSLDVPGGPVPLTESAPADAVSIERITFAPDVRVDGQAARRLQRRQGSDDRTVVTGRKTRWDSVDRVGIVSLHLDRPLDARKASRDGIVLARLEVDGRIIDASFVDRTSLLSSNDGSRVRGQAVFDGDRIDFVVPGGIEGSLAATLVQVDRAGDAVGQRVGGSGGPEAYVPATGSHDAVIECANLSALVDPESTVDGVSYDLEGVGITFRSPRVPAALYDGELRFGIALAPTGSRLAADLEEVAFEAMPEPGQAAGVTTLAIDLSDAGLSGPAGYQFGEIPYLPSGMVASWQATADTPGSAADHAAMLEAAGWSDDDGDGLWETDLTDVAHEIGRVVGRSFTASPVDWGWLGCAGDAHWHSVQDACALPPDPAIVERTADLVGAPADTLRFDPGSYVEGFAGCSVLGADEIFLGGFLLSETYGSGPGYDPAILQPFAEIGCAISERRDAGDSMALVGSCQQDGFELFHDRSRGFDTYWFYAGPDLDPAEVDAIARHYTEADTDGDGTLDRYDADVDGDGLDDRVDPDDDDDGVPDERDYLPWDASAYGSPNSFAEIIAALGG